MFLNCPPRKFSDRALLSSRLVFTLYHGALGIIEGATIKQG